MTLTEWNDFLIGKRSCRPVVDSLDRAIAVKVIDGLLKEPIIDSHVQAYLDFQSQMVEIYDDEHSDEVESAPGLPGSEDVLPRASY